jgi:hypothetical protein
MRPGAWAGSLLQSEGKGIYTLTSQEKWDKTKALITEMQVLLAKDLNSLPGKWLEQIQGFLMYVTRTYPGLNDWLSSHHRFLATR